MDILTLVNQACIRAKEPKLTNLFLNDDSSLEWLGYLTQASNRLFSSHNWSRMIKDYSFITENNDEGELQQEYDLPSDYDSLIIRYIYDNTLNLLIENESNEEALNRVASGNTSQSSIRFRIMGGEIKFTYPISNDRELRFTYKSKNFISLDTTEENSSGEEITITSYKNIFSKNEDIFLLNEELLILGTLYQRSVMNGFSDLSMRERDYQEKLREEITKDGGLRKTNMFSKEVFNKTTGTDFQKYG